MKGREDGVVRYAEIWQRIQGRSELSDEAGIKQAAAQLGVAYYTLSEWRQKRMAYGDYAFVGSSVRRDAPLNENERRLTKENAELRKANEILKKRCAAYSK